MNILHIKVRQHKRYSFLALARIKISSIQPEMGRSLVHNKLMIGLPGSGKTLLSRALPGILPKMSIDEALVGARLFQCLGDTYCRLEE